jgi:hypothetical protein
MNACATNACATQCYQAASPTAQEDLAAAIDCANFECMFEGRCLDENDTSSACNVCFNNALSGGSTSKKCAPTSDPACGACAAEWLTCISD